MAIHYRQDRELVGYLFVSSQDSAEVQEAAEEIAKFTDQCQNKNGKLLKILEEI